MKKQHLLFGTAALLTAGLVLTGLGLQQHYQDRKKKAILQMVREVFASLGTIEVAYVNDFESSDKVMTGGLVLDDGRIYQFSYDDGELIYHQEG